MEARKIVIDGIEYNMLTDEELEELKFVIALEENRKIEKANGYENYMTLEEFKNKE